ncbi:ParB/RepB/Spo0J family partition protein [Embleya sp. NPDC059237]|uniref:ParB/RepB/Spo0J family partition protein n=1 Tax=Embleya sp. NPDC059237 TaxID=3346784 RepID=UPI0036CF6A0C
MATIKLAKITPNPKQPRDEFETPEMIRWIDDLAESISKYGQLEPIVVRPYGTPVRYEIVAGECRYRASLKLGRTAIEAHVLRNPGLDELDLFELSMIENMHRKDMTPMQDARAFGRLVEGGRTVEELAERFRISTQVINLRLALLDLRPEVAQQVDKGLIGPMVGAMVAKLTKANQGAILTRIMRGDFNRDNEAIHFADAMFKAQGQEHLMLVEEMTPEQATKHRATRDRLDSAFRRVSGLEAALTFAAGIKPEELAVLLEDAVLAGQLRTIETAGESINKIRFALRQAIHVRAAHQALADGKTDETDADAPTPSVGSEASAGQGPGTHPHPPADAGLPPGIDAGRQAEADPQAGNAVPEDRCAAAEEPVAA